MRKNALQFFPTANFPTANFRAANFRAANFRAAIFLPAIAAALVATGCAHCRSSDADTNTTSCAHARSYKSPPEAVRQPGTPDNPCGEVLVREPTLEPKRILVNEGDPDREHYWFTAFWAKTSGGDWVFIPAHAEPSPGSRWPGTNPVTAMTPVRQARL